MAGFPVRFRIACNASQGCSRPSCTDLSVSSLASFCAWRFSPSVGGRRGSLRACGRAGLLVVSVGHSSRAICGSCVYSLCVLTLGSLCRLRLAGSPLLAGFGWLGAWSAFGSAGATSFPCASRRWGAVRNLRLAGPPPKWARSRCRCVCARGRSASGLLRWPSVFPPCAASCCCPPCVVGPAYFWSQGGCSALGFRGEGVGGSRPWSAWGGAVSLVVRLPRLDAGVHLSPRRLFLPKKA